MARSRSGNAMTNVARWRYASPTMAFRPSMPEMRRRLSPRPEAGLPPPQARVRETQVAVAEAIQLFQRGQVGEIFRMDLLHLSHERGAELIRHVKARRPFQRVDQHLVFRRLERPHHCRRQARIVADMTDRLLAHGRRV